MEEMSGQYLKKKPRRQPFRDREIDKSKFEHPYSKFPQWLKAGLLSLYPL